MKARQFEKRNGETARIDLLQSVNITVRDPNFLNSAVVTRFRRLKGSAKWTS
ncbi:hypothetical protein [Pseudoduganella sp. RAF53_2]|jgi:hypothetical protein|uniref:hypothetical protein n=1 Tax=Pseudoduganella sp. RAF53_2 TaxID=3233060 RepID=UPI003F977CC2